MCILLFGNIVFYLIFKNLYFFVNLNIFGEYNYLNIRTSTESIVTIMAFSQISFPLTSSFSF